MLDLFLIRAILRTLGFAIATVIVIHFVVKFW